MSEVIIDHREQSRNTFKAGMAWATIGALPIAAVAYGDGVSPNNTTVGLQDQITTDQDRIVGLKQLATLDIKYENGSLTPQTSSQIAALNGDISTLQSEVKLPSSLHGIEDAVIGGVSAFAFITLAAAVMATRFRRTAKV